MHELSASQFSCVSPLFAQTHFGVLAAGTLNGNHPGRVFSDHLTQPTCGLVCTRVGYYFLAGQIPETQHVAFCQLFQTDLAQWQVDLTGDPQMLLFYSPQMDQTRLTRLFEKSKPIFIQKKRMTLAEKASPAQPDWQTAIPVGMSMRRITPELLSKYPEKAAEIELFWGSSSTFIEKGLGYWLMDGDTITSSCESVFVGAGEAEISVATALEYRRRGLARLCVSAFIQDCQENNLSPIWGCWPENQPSVALARSLGFTEDVDQAVMVLEEPDCQAG